MRNRTDSNSAKKFRDYAAECLRMAHNASDEDRVVLLEIAEAWTLCADEVDRKAGRDRN
jgi:hypothetical protein